MKLELKRSLFFIIVIFAAAFANGQTTTRKPVDPADFPGKLIDGRYTNRYFDLELDVPPGWLLMNSEEVEATRQIGTDGLKTNSDRVNRLLDDASKGEVVLLALSKKPLGSIENSAFAIGVAKQPSSAITARMVAEASKSLLLKNAANKLLKDITVETIAGKSFASFELTLGMYGQSVPLKYYATMVGEYSLTISLSAGDSLDLKAMDTSLRSIRFVRK